VVVLIFPDKPWKQGQLERIRQFVDRGGTLLVLGEHTILDTDLVKLQDEELGTQLGTLYEKLKPFQFKRPGATKQTLDDIHKQEQELKKLFDEWEVMGRLQIAGRSGPLSRFNEALADTDVQVQFDSSTFAIGGWLQSYQALSHPTSAGIGDARNAFGAVIGASLDLRWPPAGRWPASPLVTGLWGWGDPGNALNHPSLMAKGEDESEHGPRYDPGERLGDLVLAAEERIGNGRVVVFGDTSGFTNGVNIGAHEYVSRMFAYLADPGGSPQEPARQVAGLLIALALAAVLILAGTELVPALVAIILALSLWTCTAVTHRVWEVYPDGRAGPGKANNLAYIDEAHLGHFSPESWREDGLMGLCMNLMRNDYLCLMLPEFTRERLLDADQTPRARLLISVAPSRAYSASERQTIKDFVAAGGIFLCTVGYEEAGPSSQLLEEFGFYMGGRRWRWLDRGGERAPLVHYKAGYGPANWDDALGEPKPLGHFKSPYFNGGDYYAFVRFHAGWPMDCDDPNQLLITFYPPDVPVIALRRHGLGLVTVVGDTAFAQNRNLENKDGSPFEGMRENAVFWRWLLAMFRDGMGEGERWFPQKSDTVPEGQKPAAAAKPAPSESKAKPDAKQPEKKADAAPPEGSPKTAPEEKEP
jgi:hypothetical protein